MTTNSGSTTIHGIENTGGRVRFVTADASGADEAGAVHTTEMASPG